MAPSAERSIERMAAVEEREHGIAAHADFFEGAADAEIASRGDQPFFEGGNRIVSAPSLKINFRQVEIELCVIVFHADGFAAKRFGIAKAFFSECSQQASIRKIKRIFWCNPQGAPGVEQSFVSVAVAQVLEAFLEIGHPRVRR